ncbi:MAG: TatD family hydrolase [bacterium]
MIDSHAHLHMDPLSSDIEGVMKRFVDKGGDKILSCGVDIETANREIEISMEYEQVYSAVGFHPELVIPGCEDYKQCINEKWIDENISRIENIVDNHKKVIAVGEIGLDYYWVKSNNCEKPESIYQLQQYLLKKQLDLAMKKKLPVILHCRDVNSDKHCESDILKVISCQCNSSVKGVFHSYTGSLSYLEEILNLGFYVSFNPIVMFKNADNVRQILDKVPNDRILLETDAPLLVPSEYRENGTSEPYMVDAVARYIAKKKKLSTNRLWEIVDNNFNTLFKV